MKISEIEIERFKGLRNVSFSLENGLQVIAGPNNAGKTTFISALEFFFSCEANQVSPANFAPKNGYYENEGRRALTRLKLFFSDLSESEKTEFEEAYLPRKKGIWVEIRISRQGLITYHASNNVDGKKTHEKILPHFRVIHVPALRIGSDGIASTESKRLFTTIHEILVRRRPGRDSKDQAKLKGSFARVQKLIQSVFKEGGKRARKVMPFGTELKFSVPDVAASLNAMLSLSEVITNAEGSMSIRDEGSGFQSLLALGLLDYAISGRRQRALNDLLLIEEPEAFLHPQFQRTVANYLSSLSAKAQVIVTTHSPIIIDSVPISAVARLKRQNGGLVCDWARTELSEIEAGRLERFCDAKNSELVFADKVIFCEGPTDARVVQALLNENDILSNENMNISVIDMNGKQSIHHFVSLAKRFQIDFFCIVDRDFYTGDRNGLKHLLKSLAYVPPSDFYLNLDRLRDTNCTSWSGAKGVRHKACSILNDLNCFVLSSDIEGAVLSSIKQSSLLQILKSEDLKLINEEVFQELAGLTGVSYYSRLFGLFGSKGWNLDRGNKNNCPKPHVMASIVGRSNGALIRDSDVSVLKKRLVSFIK